MTKNTINARIVADSLSPQGERITTFVLTYPRIIHAEMMTHRLFSRNAASSRAIPFNKMVKSIEEDPFIPIAWQKNHKGMQGTKYIVDPNEIAFCKQGWLRGRDAAVLYSEQMNDDLDITKQLCNRLLEPFQWYTCLVTATEFENFFELRAPKYKFGETYYKSRRDLYNKMGSDFDAWPHETEEWWYSINESQAEIHIQALAEAMWDAQNESKPKQLQAGEWHIPFGDRMDTNELKKLEESLGTRDRTRLALSIATARAARLSYMTFDGEINYTKDIALHDQLLESGHFSPFEHCARAMDMDEYVSFVKGSIDIIESEEPNPGDYVAYCKVWNFDKETGWCNNFKGFVQYRYLLEGGPDVRS